MRLPQSSSSSISIHFVSITIIFAFAVISSLPAKGATQQLQCSPASLKFGKVAVGGSETQLITLTNTGQTNATVSAISAASGFSVSGVNLPLNLSAGQSINLNVAFAPTAAGWTGGEVTFTSNASDPNLKLEVGGTGAQGGNVTATPATLSFGQLAVGSQKTLAVTVTNVGSWKTTLTGFQAEGTGFSVSGPNVPVVLNRGQSATLNVTFSPQAAGLTGGSIWISGAALNIPLTGTGTTTTVDQLTIAPTSLNFGSVDIGNTTTQPSTITASGGSVTVSSASSSSSQFSIAGASFPLTLSAGQSAQFNVIYAPTTSGSASATLTLISNASDSKATEALSGTGVSPQYSVNLSWNTSTSSVIGYNVYRGTAPGSYSKINTSVDPSTTYSDSAVVSGTTYYYAATAVNSTGQESNYSSPVQVAIP